MIKRVIRSLPIVLLLTFASSPPVRAVEALQALGFCSEVQNYVNALVDFTNTKCLPGGAKKKGSFDLLMISEKPVFSVPAAKNAWLLVVVASVGKVSRENPDMNVSEVWVS